MKGQSLIASLFGLDRRVHDLPEDLRRRLGESALLKLALDAAQEGAAERLWLRDLGEAQPGPQVLLALLTYCYAAGIFGSQDVEWACHNDHVVRSICPNACPDWRAIWHFRNANRPWIEESLARVYETACGAAPTEAGREPAPVPAARAEGPADIVSFVQRQIRHAVWTDAAMFD